MKKCTIVCGFHPLINKECEDTYVVGVDKGCQYLMENNIKIDAAIGDFDSVLEDEYLKISTYAKKIIKLNPIKDDTDLEHALNYAKENGFDDITVYGCLGGRQDHNLLNIKLLYLSELNLTYIDNKNKVFCLKKGEHQIYKGEYKYMSLFTFEPCTFKMNGVFYPLDKTTITINDNYTTSNEILDEKAFIKIYDGKLLVMQCTD